MDDIIKAIKLPQLTEEEIKEFKIKHPMLTTQIVQEKTTSISDKVKIKYIDDQVIFNKGANKTICWFNGEKYISTNKENVYDFRIGFGACYYKALLIKYKNNRVVTKYLRFMQNSKQWKLFYESLYYVYFKFDKKFIDKFEKRIETAQENKPIPTMDGLPF